MFYDNQFDREKYIYIYIYTHTQKKYRYIHTPHPRCTLAEELAAATRVMQSSSNELSILVSGNAKNVNKQKPIHNPL